MSSLMARLPDELLARCAGFLDLPSAGHLAQASRAGQRLVFARLVEVKAERAAALAAAAAPPPAAPRFTAPGEAFIDAFANLLMGAAPPQRCAGLSSTFFCRARSTRLCHVDCLSCLIGLLAAPFSRPDERGGLSAATAGLRLDNCACATQV